MKEHAKRVPSPSATTSVKPTPVPATTGRPLDPTIRAHAEPRLGFDLSHVRIYADDEAARSAARMGAGAYTVGPHIVFGRDAYRPGDAEGRRLLFHELAHSAQQHDARPSGPPVRAPGGENSALERQADAIADRLASGDAVSRGMISTAPQAIQCAPPPKKNLTEPQVLFSLDKALEEKGIPYNTEVAGTLTVNLPDGSQVVSKVRFDRIYQGWKMIAVEAKGVDPNAFTKGQSILSLAQQYGGTFVVSSAAGSPPTSGKVADIPFQPGDVIELEPGDTHVVHGNRTGSKVPDPGGPNSADIDTVKEGLQSYPIVVRGTRARFTTRGEPVQYIDQSNVEAFQKERGVLPPKPQQQPPLPKKPPTQINFETGGEAERPRYRVAPPPPRQVRVAPVPPPQPTQAEIDLQAEHELHAEQEYTEDLDASNPKRRLSAQSSRPSDAPTTETVGRSAPAPQVTKTATPTPPAEVPATSTPASTAATPTGVNDVVPVPSVEPVVPLEGTATSSTPASTAATPTGVNDVVPVPSVEPVVPLEGTVPEGNLGATAFEGAKGFAGDLAGFVAENAGFAVAMAGYAMAVGWVQGKFEEGKIEKDLEFWRPSIERELQALAPKIEELKKHGKVYSHVSFDVQYVHDFISSTQNYDDYYLTTDMAPVTVDDQDIGSLQQKSEDGPGWADNITIKHNRVTVSKLLWDPEAEKLKAEAARITENWKRRAAATPPKKAPKKQPVALPPTLNELIQSPTPPTQPPAVVTPLGQALFAPAQQTDQEWWLSRLPLAKSLAAQWAAQGEMISSDNERLQFLQHEAQWREEATVLLEHFKREGPAWAAAEMDSLMGDTTNGGARLRDLRRANGGAD
jgi:hypothetical protein